MSAFALAVWLITLAPAADTSMQNVRSPRALVGAYAAAVADCYSKYIADASASFSTCLEDIGTDERDAFEAKYADDETFRDAINVARRSRDHVIRTNCGPSLRIESLNDEEIDLDTADCMVVVAAEMAQFWRDVAFAHGVRTSRR